MKRFMIPLVFVAAMLGQTPAVKSQKQSVAAKPRIDTVIQLVQGGMSESLVIKTLQQQGKTYLLSPEDMVKLQKAGVTEPIIVVMTDPKASVVLPTTKASTTPAPDPPTVPETATTNGPSPNSGASAPAPAPPAEATADIPLPPPLPNTPPERKRRVVIANFDFGAVKGQAQGPIPYPWSIWYRPGASPQNVTGDIGKGIRAMLESQLQQTNAVTILERNAAIEGSIIDGRSALRDLKSQPRMGRILGPDCIVTGNITIFGRDDKTKKKGLGGFGIPDWKGFGAGLFGQTEKEEKAVVGLVFHIVDAETSEMLLTGSVRGESTRKSKTLGIEALGIGRGGAVAGGFGSAMTSSDFAETILGEATIAAVNKIVQQVEARISQIPLNPRDIEGRVVITANGVYLTVGRNDGVLLGDRFEIRQINGEVVNPQTKEVIALQTVKVGELVVSQVDDEHAAIGNYGGQPLSPDYAKMQDKGYQARLMSK